MGRMIAQLVCHSLLPEAVDNTKIPYLEGLFGFLHDNADMVRNLLNDMHKYASIHNLCIAPYSGLLIVYHEIVFSYCNMCLHR